MSTLQLRQWAERSAVSFGTSGARGKVVDMTPAVCHAYVAAFIQSVVPHARALVLGHDLRPSSPGIAAVCAAAARHAGLEVVYGGALPTPALALYAAQHGLPAVVVTGSHIPFDRNGIKFYRADGEISKADEAAMLQTSVTVPSRLQPWDLPPPDQQVEQAYVDRYLRFFGPDALAGKVVAVYEHSSVARDIARRILEGLGARVVSLGRTDVFVPIDTEAVRPEDVAQARAWAQAHRFDALVTTDGDADRPLIGDESGEWMRGDLVGVVCARHLQASFVVTPVSSNSALERSAWFGHTVRTRIGSPYVIEGMQQAIASGHSCVVGYEANGGFLLGNAIHRNGRVLQPLPTRDAMLPIVAVLCSAREQGQALSALGTHLPQRFTASDRIQQIPTSRSQALIAQLRADPVALAQVLAPDAGAVHTVDETDGLRVQFQSGDIVHVRPSGNAPELRCYTESSQLARAQQLCAACLGRILERVAQDR